MSVFTSNAIPEYRDYVALVTNRLSSIRHPETHTVAYGTGKRQLTVRSMRSESA